MTILGEMESAFQDIIESQVPFVMLFIYVLQKKMSFNENL